MRYLITFACYGGRLHGDESGSVDRRHNQVGSRLLEPDPPRVLAERQTMTQQAHQLDRESRSAVLVALRCHSVHCGWNLLAAHVRTTHVHVVVEAEVGAERIMSAFKSYASRELNRLGRDGPDRRRWAPRKHALVTEGQGRRASYAIRNRWARCADGTVRCRRGVIPRGPLPSGRGSVTSFWWWVTSF